MSGPGKDKKNNNYEEFRKLLESMLLDDYKANEKSTRPFIAGTKRDSIYTPRDSEDKGVEFAVDKAIAAMQDGKDVFVQKSSGEYHKISFSENGFVLEEKATEFADPSKNDELLRYLNDKLKDLTEKIGTTLTDTEEYTAMHTSLSNAIKTLKETAELDKVSESLRDLNEKAGAYYNAKLTSNQNDRRFGRFLIAAELKNFDIPLVRQDPVVLLKKGLKEKTYKAYLETIVALKSSGKNEADRILNDAQLFEQNAVVFAEKNNLDLMYRDKVLSDLEKSFRKEPSALIGDTVAFTKNIPVFEYTDGMLSKRREALKSIQGNDLISNKAFGIDPASYDKNNIWGLASERSALSHLAVGRLLLEGKSFEDIISGRVSRDDMLRVGKEVVEKYRSASHDIFDEYAARGYDAVMKESIRYFRTNYHSGIVLSDLTKDENKHLLDVSVLLQGTEQDIEKMRKAVAGLEGNSAESVQSYTKTALAFQECMKRYHVIGNTVSDMYSADYSSDNPALFDQICKSAIPSGAAIMLFKQEFSKKSDAAVKDMGDRINLQFSAISAMLMSNPQYAEAFQQIKHNSDAMYRLADSMSSGEFFEKVIVFKDGECKLIAPEEFSNVVGDCAKKPVELTPEEKVRKIRSIPTYNDILVGLGIRFGDKERGELDTQELNPDKLMITRSALESVVIGRLLLTEGFSVDKLLNQQVTDKDREKISAVRDEVLKKYKEGTREEFGTYYAEAYNAILDQGMDYFYSVYEGDLKPQDLFSYKNRNLCALSTLLTDAAQESDRNKTYINGLDGNSQASVTEKKSEQTSICNTIDSMKKNLDTAAQILADPNLNQGAIGNMSLRIPTMDMPMLMGGKSFQNAYAGSGTARGRDAIRGRMFFAGVMSPAAGKAGMELMNPDYAQHINDALSDPSSAVKFADMLVSGELTDKLFSTYGDNAAVESADVFKDILSGKAGYNTALVNTLKEKRAAVAATGITSGDSKEFRLMKNSLDTAIEVLSNTCDPKQISSAMKRLNDRADAYYRAKLTQPHNSRRSKRFELASQLREFTPGRDERSPEVRWKDTVAAKALKTKLTEMTKSGTQEQKEAAAHMLEDKAEFDRNVKANVENQRFKDLYDRMDLQQLKASFDRISTKNAAEQLDEVKVESIRNLQ